MFTTKAQARQTLQHLSKPEFHGRLGQNIRQLDLYRNSRQIFVSPAPILSQLRINALIDGKEVIMPAAGLKDGFYLLEPFTIPFPKLSFAVTMKGLLQFGKLLSLADIKKLAIELLITDAIAVDEYGTRLGDGEGFFDLSCAIFAEHKALTGSSAKIAVFDDECCLVSDELPGDDWDVRIDGIISPKGIQQFSYAAKQNHAIYWDELPKKRIKRMKPLWDIWCGLNPSTPTQSL